MNKIKLFLAFIAEAQGIRIQPRDDVSRLLARTD
jgi:hypothetical protein